MRSVPSAVDRVRGFRADPLAAVRFALVGAGATLGYAIAALAAVEAGVPAAAASLLGYAVGGIVSYGGHRVLTFRSGRPHREALPRYALVAGAGYLLALLVPLALVEALGWSPRAAVLANAVLLPLASAAAMRLWVFPAPMAGDAPKGTVR